MKLSIFTTVTDPNRRGDNYIDARRCYQELANEVVIVDGSAYNYLKPRNRIINRIEHSIKLYHEWPKEFSWEFIGQQFQRGYEACTGDWVIRADLDMLFHEKDFRAIREACAVYNDQPALSFYKWQFILPDRYNLKSRLVLAVNKGKFGDRIRFDSGGDLCQPSLDGEELTPDSVPEAAIPVYNYEKLLKTREQIAQDQGRMERAWFRLHGEYQMKSDGTDEGALDRWIQAQKGKFSKPQRHIKLEEHPKFIQQTIKNLKPENWGYSGFGELEVNSYA